MLKPTVLIVDDEKPTREGLRAALEDRYDVYIAEDGESAIRLLEEDPFDVLLTDLRMPGVGGLDLIKRAKSLSKPPICILMTAYGSEEMAVDAMRQGADDYIAKGRLQIDELEMRIARALRSQTLESENRELRSHIDTKFGIENVLGQSSAMQEIFEIVQQVAPARASVLVLGESGTGKELIAKAIHNLSPRAKQPLVTVHCAALSPTLLESELFGHEKGAFTGAHERRIGRFEQANGGTLFLDEIGEIDQSIQVKLLRFLGERTFERVGSNNTQTADVRLIAATNRKLEESVDKREFRQDLYFRLNVIPLALPALRERMDDLPVLVDHFLDKHARLNKRERPSVSPETMAILGDYRWRGNVRELENVVERALLLCNGKEVLPHNLLMHSQTGQGSLNADLAAAVSLNDSASGTPAALLTAKHTAALGIEVGMSMKEAEKKLIFETLRETKGNRTRAAQMLGISIRTLRNKLNEYRADGKEFDFDSGE